MADLKTVGIKELKNNLSAYLREVRRGTRILVSDRSRVVAELHEPGAGYAAPEAMDPVLAAWVDAGVVRLPFREKKPLPASPVHLEDGTTSRLLEQDRRDAGE